MTSLHRVRVKVCCVRGVDEAERATAAGVDAIGLVSAMPSGPGVVDDATIASVARAILERPPGRRPGVFLLTAGSTAAAVLEQWESLSERAGVAEGVPFVDTLQLVATPPAEELASLRRAIPGVTLVTVVHVVGPESLDVARAAAVHADALLLDSGRPDEAIPVLGGTGCPHDWGTSARIVAEVDVPVWLAGGLRPENVGEAMRAVRPHGVDVCSGLRPEGGELSDELLERFLAEVRGVGDRGAGELGSDRQG